VVVEEVLKFGPQAVETFDDKTFKIVFKFLPIIIWRLKGSILQLASSFLPEVGMVLTGGIPKLIMLVEFTGNTQVEADQKAKNALEKIKKFGYKVRVTKNELEMQKYWLFRHESFNLLRNKLRGFKVAPFIEDLIVPDEYMPEFISNLQKILDQYKFIYTIQGHAGNGNFHIFPLMKLENKKEIDVIKEINQKVFSLVQKYHGSISAEHNDGLVRTPYLYFMFSDKMLDLFEQVKSIFDPTNIFNPGKKVGGSIEKNYARIELNK
jgi:FAD/FMN-containing dehydrogenase